MSAQMCRLSHTIALCNREWTLTSIKGTWLKTGTHQTDTRWTAGTRMAGRTQSRWPVSLWAGAERTNCYSCEDKHLFELADTARGEAKNDPENTTKQQTPFSVRAMCTHTYQHTYTYCLALRLDQNAGIEIDWQRNRFDTCIYMCRTHTYTHTCTVAQWTEIAAVNYVGEWNFCSLPSLWCWLCGTLLPLFACTSQITV